MLKEIFFIFMPHDRFTDSFRGLRQTHNKMATINVTHDESEILKLYDLRLYLRIKNKKVYNISLAVDFFNRLKTANRAPLA